MFVQRENAKDGVAVVVCVNQENADSSVAKSAKLSLTPLELVLSILLPKTLYVSGHLHIFFHDSYCFNKHANKCSKKLLL